MQRHRGSHQFLLQSAADLVAEGGVRALSIQAIADRAGVTKGALFHYFPSKQVLLDCMVTDLLKVLDETIDVSMKNDPRQFGSFTRAYVNSVFANTDFGFHAPRSQLFLAILAEPTLRRHWRTWLSGRLRRHSSTDDHEQLRLVRLAVDGAWLSHAALDTDALHTLQRRLLFLTHRSED